MSRIQPALNVSNVDEAVECYRRFPGAEPAKRRPGYASPAIADPPGAQGVGEASGIPAEPWPVSELV